MNTFFSISSEVSVLRQTHRFVDMTASISMIHFKEEQKKSERKRENSIFFLIAISLFSFKRRNRIRRSIALEEIEH